MCWSLSSCQTVPFSAQRSPVTVFNAACRRLIERRLHRLTAFLTDKSNNRNVLRQSIMCPSRNRCAVEVNPLATDIALQVSVTAMHSVQTAGTYVVSVKFNFVRATTHRTSLGCWVQLCARSRVMPDCVSGSFITVAPGIIARAICWHAWSSFTSGFNGIRFRFTTGSRLWLLRWQLFTTTTVAWQRLFATAACCSSPRSTTGMKTGMAGRKTSSFTRFTQK